MFSPIKYLKKALVEEKIIDQHSLDQMIAQAEADGVLLTDSLIKTGMVLEDKLVSLIAEALSHQALDFSDIKIEKEILETVPKTIVVLYQVMPIIRLGHTLVLAMVNPSDVLTMDHIKALTGFGVHPVLCSPKDIEQGVAVFYTEDTNRALEEIMRDISDLEDMELIKESHKSTERDRAEKSFEGAPTIRLTDAIIKQGVVTK
ncbi:MAG: hypothetical protein NT079_04170, partial [Candidatus Omnitrophica bacterium]|nr:hypothetical protein [Candidatus Omnitrophota bacterium]